MLQWLSNTISRVRLELSGSPAVAPITPRQFQAIFPRRPARLGRDTIRNDVFAPPYRSPDDLDRYGGETREMRFLYRRHYHAEPVVRSAVQGKINRVVCLEVSVLPADKDRVADRLAAEFVNWTIQQSARGWEGLLTDMLTPACIDGWSVLEKKLRPVRHPTLGLLWGLDHLRSLDSDWLRLEMDVYRNVTAVVNTVMGLEYHPTEQVVLYSHNGLFNNPFGQSDLRATHRAASILSDVYQIWYVALKVYGYPYAVGKVKDATRRKMMENALKALRAGGYAVTHVDDSVEVINLASASNYDAFQTAVKTLREDVYLSVCGAYLPFMEGQGAGGDSHGDAGVAKSASDATEEVLARFAAHALSRQLFPCLVEPNFPPGTGIPRLRLGGNNYGESKQAIEVITAAQACGLEVSAEWAHEVTKIEPPRDADDTLRPPGQPGQGPDGGGGGMPGTGGGPDGGGSPAGLPPGGPGADLGGQPQPQPQAEPRTFAAAAKPHSYSSTHVPITGPARDRLLALGRLVRDEDRADDGREDDPHVTVRYGLHANDPEAVRPLLAGAGPIRFRLGGASVFRGAESGKPYDVIKVDVESPELVRLNRSLAALPHTDTHPEYQPHATIAYVKAGLGDGYARRMGAVNLDATADRVVFSDRDQNQTVIPRWTGGVPRSEFVATPTAVAPAPFSAADVPNYARYFAADARGHYPGTLHRQFGCDLRTFADRSHLVRKQVTNKLGKRQWVWANPNKKEPEPKPAGWQPPQEKAKAIKAAKEPARQAARDAYQKALADPSQVTAADLAALAAHIDTLTRDELKEHARAVKAKLGGLKAELVDRLLADVRAKVEGAKQQPPSAPAKPGPVAAGTPAKKPKPPAAPASPPAPPPPPSEPKPAPKPEPAAGGKAPAKEAAKQAVAAAVKDPLAADLTAVAAHLKALSVAELGELAQANAILTLPYQKKQQKIDAILEELKLRQWKAGVQAEQDKKLAGTKHFQSLPDAAGNGKPVPSDQFKEENPHANEKGTGDDLVEGIPNPDLPDHARPPIPDKATAKALNRYTWGYDAGMNAALRDTGAPPPGKFGGDDVGKPGVDGPKMFKAMQTAFAGVKPWHPPVTVYRGIPALTPEAVANLEAAAIQAKITGGVATMPGFVSTTTAKDSAFSGPVQFTIHATQGLDAQPYSHFAHEKELLLNHNCQYKVRSVTRTGGRLHIELEQVSGGLADRGDIALDGRAPGSPLPDPKAKEPAPPPKTDMQVLQGATEAADKYGYEGFKKHYMLLSYPEQAAVQKLLGFKGLVSVGDLYDAVKK